MYSDGSALERLSRDQCLTLMASVPVGRIIYTQRALPAVELVNFALDQGDIVIRTDRSGKLAAATRGAVVAFEADQLDLDSPVRLERHRHRAVERGNRSRRARPAADDRAQTVGHGGA